MNFHRRFLPLVTAGLSMIAPFMVQATIQAAEVPTADPIEIESPPTPIEVRLGQIQKNLLYGDSVAIPAPEPAVEQKRDQNKTTQPLKVAPPSDQRPTLLTPKTSKQVAERLIQVKAALVISKPQQSEATQTVNTPEQDHSIGNPGNSQNFPITSIGQNYLSLPTVPSRSGRVMAYPLPSIVPITSGFGWRWGRLHRGIDLGVATGTPVGAVLPGVVVEAGNAGDGYGNKVVLQHEDGSRTLYAHLDRIFVQPGQSVEASSILGLSGNTGNSTGPHLHLEWQVPTQAGGYQAFNFLPTLQSAELARKVSMGMGDSKENINEAIYNADVQPSGQVIAIPQSGSLTRIAPLPNTGINQVASPAIPVVGMGGETERPAGRRSLFRQIGAANPEFRKSAILKSNEIRVAIAQRSPAVRLGSSTPAWIIDTQGIPIDYIPGGTAFVTTPINNQIQIGTEKFPSRFFIQPINNGLISLNGKWYRGRILVSLDRGKLTIVNWLDLESYTASVVGAESIPSWNAEALKAQAIASRSYAMNYRNRPASPLFDLGNTESHQVYKGVASEYNTTWAATQATRGQVLIDLRSNTVMLTQYAATQEIVNSAHGGYNSMSQTGAAEMANQGFSYLQILGRYYHNAAIGVFRSG